MGDSDSSYEGIVKAFCKESIPNWYYLFRITKCCGYSSLVIVPKYSTVSDLKKIINLQHGPNVFLRIFFISTEPANIYLHTMHNTTPIRDLIRDIPVAYGVDECPLSVYQLYYEFECICK